jgi:hypothetical protein
MIQQYEFDDTTTSTTILHRHDIASTSISETRKTTSTRKVEILFMKFILINIVFKGK